MANNIKIVGNIKSTTKPSRFDDKDINLMSPPIKFKENFGEKGDYIEYFVYDIDENLLNINYDYLSYKLPSDSSLKPAVSSLPNTTGNIQTENIGITSTLATPTSSLYPIIEIDPVQDLQNIGYSTGEFLVKYNIFHNKISDPINQALFVKEISPDRTEVRLASTTLTDIEIESVFNSIMDEMDNSTYYVCYLLNFGNNNQYLTINLALNKIPGGYEILFKLYHPLPPSIQEKQTLWVVEEKSSQYVFDINLDKSILLSIGPKLRGPNFDITIPNQSTISTTYNTYDNLVNGLQFLQQTSYHQILSLLTSQSVQVNVDYTDFNNFVFFGSAYQRVTNFYTKAKQIEGYRNLINSRSTLTSSRPALIFEINTYSSSINNIISQFDGYESFLYFQSSSYTWPKSGTTKPFSLLSTGSSNVLSWYPALTSSAQDYDANNYDNLVYATPSFIQNDNNNAPFSLFLNMIGHYFDNIWVALKSVTDINLANNNLDYGISKDLVYERLKSLGIHLYNSQAGENVAQYLIGANTGSSLPPSISTPGNDFSITGSYLNNIPRKDLVTELYKRIYHNLPLLVKTKGTVSGLDHLTTIFGITGSILNIKEFGGSLKSNLIKGYNNDKVRIIDNIIYDNSSGSVLSPFISLQTSPTTSSLFRDDDMNYVDVSFSPQTQIDTHISKSIASNNPSWSLDDYIGDPRQQYNTTYTDLDAQRKLYFQTGTPSYPPLTGSSAFAAAGLNYNGSIDYNGFIRLIQFFDNALFKMLEDFTPERTSLSTGVTFNSPVLERNKAVYANPTNTTTQSIYEGEVSSSTISSTYGTFYNTLSASNNTAGWYTGELSGSGADIHDHFEEKNYNPYLYDWNVWNKQHPPTQSIDRANFNQSDFNVLLNNVSASVKSTVRQNIENKHVLCNTYLLTAGGIGSDGYTDFRYKTCNGDNFVASVIRVYIGSPQTICTLANSSINSVGGNTGQQTTLIGDCSKDIPDLRYPAELQDSNLSLRSYNISRYEGSKTTSLKYNTYTPYIPYTSSILSKFQFMAGLNWSTWAGSAGGSTGQFSTMQIYCPIGSPLDLKVIQPMATASLTSPQYFTIKQQPGDLYNIGNCNGKTFRFNFVYRVGSVATSLYPTFVPYESDYILIAVSENQNLPDNTQTIDVSNIGLRNDFPDSNNFIQRAPYIYIGDDSYGKTAAIDYNSLKVGWVKHIPSQSLNFSDKTQIQLKYLVDKDQNITDLSLKNNNLIEVQNIFRSGDPVVVSLSDTTFPSFQKTLDGTKTIFRGGFSYDPILFRENKEILNFKYLTPQFAGTFNKGIFGHDLTHWTGITIGSAEQYGGSIFYNQTHKIPTALDSQPTTDASGSSGGFLWYKDNLGVYTVQSNRMTDGLNQTDYGRIYQSLGNRSYTNFTFDYCTLPYDNQDDWVNDQGNPFTNYGLDNLNFVGTYFNNNTISNQAYYDGPYVDNPIVPQNTNTGLFFPDLLVRRYPHQDKDNFYFDTGISNYRNMLDNASQADWMNPILYRLNPYPTLRVDQWWDFYFTSYNRKAYIFDNIFNFNNFSNRVRTYPDMIESKGYYYESLDITDNGKFTYIVPRASLYRVKIEIPVSIKIQYYKFLNKSTSTCYNMLKSGFTYKHQIAPDNRWGNVISVYENVAPAANNAPDYNQSNNYTAQLIEQSTSNFEPHVGGMGSLINIQNNSMWPYHCLGPNGAWSFRSNYWSRIKKFHYPGVSFKIFGVLEKCSNINSSTPPLWTYVAATSIKDSIGDNYSVDKLQNIVHFSGGMGEGWSDTNEGNSYDNNNILNWGGILTLTSDSTRNNFDDGITISLNEGEVLRFRVFLLDLDCFFMYGKTFSIDIGKPDLSQRSNTLTGFSKADLPFFPVPSLLVEDLREKYDAYEEETYVNTSTLYGIAGKNIIFSSAMNTVFQTSSIFLPEQPTSNKYSPVIDFFSIQPGDLMRIGSFDSLNPQYYTILSSSLGYPDGFTSTNSITTRAKFYANYTFDEDTYCSTIELPSKDQNGLNSIENFIALLKTTHGRKFKVSGVGVPTSITNQIFTLQLDDFNPGTIPTHGNPYIISYPNLNIPNTVEGGGSYYTFMLAISPPLPNNPGPGIIPDFGAGWVSPSYDVNNPGGTLQYPINGGFEVTLTALDVELSQVYTLTLNREVDLGGINTGNLNSQNFAILRPKPDETSVIIDFRKTQGDVSQTILIPQDASEDLKSNVGTIFQKLNVDLSNQSQNTTP